MAPSIVDHVGSFVDHVSIDAAKANIPVPLDVRSRTEKADKSAEFLPRLKQWASFRTKIVIKKRACDLAVADPFDIARD